MFDTLFSMEDQTSETIGQQTGEGVTGETEAQVAEVVQGQTQIDQMAQVPQTAVQSVETLEQVQQAASDSLEQNGGMTPGEVAQAQIAVEAVKQRLNMPRGRSVFMGMESFADRNQRGESTRLAIEEGIGATIKSIWEKLKKFFKDLWGKIVGFFRKIMLGAESLKKNAEKLKSEVSSIGNKKMEKPGFEDEGLANGFAINGKMNTKNPEVILANHQSLLDGHKTLFAAFETYGKQIEGVTKDIEKIKEDDKAKSEEIATKIHETCKKFVDDAGKSIKSTVITEFSRKAVPGSVEAGHQSDELYNNKRWVMFLASSNQDASNVIVGGKNVAITSSVFFQIKKVDASSTKVTSTLCPTLSTGEMTSLCDAVIKIANDTAKGDENIRNVTKWGNDLDAIVNQAMSVAGKMDSDSDASKIRKTALSAVQKTISQAGSAFASYYSATPSMAVEAGKAALRYVHASMKQYKEEK